MHGSVQYDGVVSGEVNKSSGANQTSTMNSALSSPLTTKIKSTSLLASLFFSTVAAAEAELPKLMLPAGVGVNIDFIEGHERDLDLIAEAGFKYIRMDFKWGVTEQTKGIYDWSGYDKLTRNLERRGLCAYYILDYSNPLHEEMVMEKDHFTKGETKVAVSPQHPQSVAAFARWAAAAAKHFQGRQVVWEIWNEPNIFFWKPQPDVNQYTALALATMKAVRAADPQATIFAPAASEFPWPFLENFFKAGALEYLDGVSVHPYRPANQPPETVEKDYQKLRELIARYTPPTRRAPVAIISGEWGYATHIKGVSLETQAGFIVRQQLANLMSGVPVSIWYDWKNDGNDPNDQEHNFGTVSPNLTPKPAYFAIKTLTHELAGFTIRNRLPTEGTNDFVLVLTNAVGGIKLAVWTLGAPHSITLPLQTSSAKELSLVDGGGFTGRLEIKDHSVTLPVNDLPRYVALGQTRLR